MIISYQLMVDRWQGGWLRSRSPWPCDFPQMCLTPYGAIGLTSHHQTSKILMMSGQPSYP